MRVSTRTNPLVVSPNPFAPLDFLPFFGRVHCLGPLLSLDTERETEIE
jgi:hypothetical protein